MILERISINAFRLAFLISRFPACSDGAYMQLCPEIELNGLVLKFFFDLHTYFHGECSFHCKSRIKLLSQIANINTGFYFVKICSLI